MTTPARDTEVKRGDIKERVRIAIWAKAAGRCMICNERLLGAARTFWHSATAGQLAHNVGATPTPGSPRGMDAEIEDREAEENLLLLCNGCHRMVDHEDFIEAYPVARLGRLKKEHEDRIERQTRTGGLTRTAVLRVGATVRGHRLMPTRAQVSKALVAADFLPVAESNLLGDHECLLPGDTADGWFWDAAKSEIDKVISRVRDAVGAHDVEHVSVFAGAPIPALVYLGFELDDKTETRVFQGRPDTGWEPVHHDSPATFRFATAEGDPSEVVLLVSVTAPVNENAIPEPLRRLSRLTLTPNTAPSTHLVDDMNALANFTATFKEMTAAAEQLRGAKWHLIAAVPAAAAVAMGQSLMRGAQPRTVVYQRSTNTNYENVLEVNQ